jgi:hypothetical protein
LALARRPTAGATPALGNFETEHGSSKGGLGPYEVCILALLLRHQLLGAYLGGCSSLQVDLICPLGRVGQNGDMRGTYLHESSANGNELVFLARSL